MAARRFGKRKIVRYVCFVFVVILLLTVFAINRNKEAERYKENLRNIHTREISNFSYYLSMLETDITKEIYSGTPVGQSKIAANLLSNAMSAKSSLCKLPLEDSEIGNIYNFLSKVEGFSRYIINTTHDSTGNLYMDKEDVYGKLDELLSYLHVANTEFKNIVSKFDEEKMLLRDNSLLNISRKTDNNTINLELTGISEAFENYNELSLRGPCFYCVNGKKAKLLENKETITVKQAEEIALKFLNNNASLSFFGETAGNLETYTFTADNIVISITKKGGYVAYFTNSRFPSESILNFNEAAEKSRDFLISHGIENVKETYFNMSGNICTITYVFRENSILYLNDSIKISVALDNGEIIAFQNVRYIMNHQKRDFNKDYISKQDVIKCLNPKLRVIGDSLVCINTDNSDETICFEFECISKNDTKVLVYINAFSAVEEKVLILRESEKNKFIL